MKELGKLERVDLRTVWDHEAIDFTNWLAKEESLSLLGDEIGVDIRLIKTEDKIGDFKVDIHAEEENTERKIIIENQLESTNHDHLGKIITYASGLDSEIIIWIVKEVREEHRKAVDWLNEHTDEEINFFIVKMELWKVGDSPPAPKFHIVSKPNDWAKAVKKSFIESELSDTRLLQLKFWNEFIEFSKKSKTSLGLRKAKPHHWYDIAIGSSEAHMSLSVNTQDNKVGVEIYIPKSKKIFHNLEKNKTEIEKILETRLSWMGLPQKKASRIKLSSSIDITKESNWEEAFKWMNSWGEKFRNVFSKEIKRSNELASPKEFIVQSK